MRQALSNLESDILYHIDTGCDRKTVKERIPSKSSWTTNEINQAIKSLRVKDIIHYENRGKFLVAHFGEGYGKKIKFDNILGVYTYEDGK